MKSVTLAQKMGDPPNEDEERQKDRAFSFFFESLHIDSGRSTYLGRGNEIKEGLR